jgi:hypothetical protein
MKNNASFKYFETNDREQITQYVELRRRVYLKEYPWLSADFGFADETDNLSRIVIAAQGNVVAGGARLTISTPGRPRRLPLEETGFDLKSCELLKELGLDREPYGEISRMAASPESAHGFEISGGLAYALASVAAHEGLDVVFSICPAKPARINRINAARLGIGFHKYHDLPTVFDVDMALCAFTGILKVFGNAGKEAA